MVSEGARAWLRGRSEDYENSKVSTAIQTVFDIVIRIVQFEIVPDRWQFEPQRTANRDSRHLCLEGILQRDDKHILA